jgi:hypothetical protein
VGPEPTACMVRETSRSSFFVAESFFAAFKSERVYVRPDSIRDWATNLPKKSSMTGRKTSK